MRRGKKKLKILICDPLDPEGLEILRKEKGLEIIQGAGKSSGELKKLLKDAVGVIVRSGTKLTADLIRSSRQLRIIGRAGVGLDNVDVGEASRQGVVVVNTPAGNTISAAEHTFSLILALSRNISPAHWSMKEGKWERKKFMGVELFDKTIGLVGLGRIGQEVAKRAQSFGMRVLAFDPYLRTEQAQKLGVCLVEMTELIKKSDYISLHIPLTPETRNIIGSAALKKVKKGVRIINCARGGLVDEAALTPALKKGRVAGVALDVFEKEPPEKNILFSHPKVVTTPHLGASTEEAQIKVSIDIARTLVDFLNDKGIRNAVNMPSLDPETLKELKPHIDLSEKMGLMLAQLAGGRFTQVHIRYDGQIAEVPTESMTVAFIKGLLTPVMAENVNFVNASVLARTRGIKITESKSLEPRGFSNLIHVTLRTSKERKSIGGTVYQKNDSRIVLIDNQRVELHAKGNVLCTSHEDSPGVVGRIGTLLGQNGINIADMTVGRNRPGGLAHTLISLDKPTPPAVLNKIRKIPRMKQAKIVRL